MHIVDTMMIAGLCMMVGAAIFLLGAGLKARRTGDHGLRDDPPGGRLDLYMLVLWGGMLLVQASNIFLHKQSGALFNVSALTWAGTAGVVFVCGAFTGRLLLRLELRRYKEKREEQSGAARA